MRVPLRATAWTPHVAAEGQPPTTTAEWCRATGEPTPLERRFGPGLTERQYALLEALFDLATGGGLGPHEGVLDLSVLNAVLARRDHGPATRAEVLAALRRSAEALETRRAENHGHLALMCAVRDLAREVGLEPGRPVLAALDRAGFRSRRLTEGGWQPTTEELALLERAARECVAAEPDAANAARALLRRSRGDAALREAVLSSALVTAVSERLRDPDSMARTIRSRPPPGGRARRRCSTCAAGSRPSPPASIGAGSSG